jgi:hypothetical protein
MDARIGFAKKVDRAAFHLKAIARKRAEGFYRRLGFRD